MKCTDYIAEFLVRAGVTHVFELSGGMIAHLLDSFSRHKKLNVISVHHEQSGAFAAEGFARYSGKPAVALGTSGPGALNLVTGIASCYYDSIPAIFITGQVQTYLQRADRAVRQFGLQECEFSAVVKSISKDVYAPKAADELPATMERAFATALGDRPGPVVIELPFDVQGSAVDAEPGQPSVAARKAPDASAINTVVELLAEAERPIVLAGGGIRASSSHRQFREFARALQIPVVCSIMALDVMAGDDPLRVGLTGIYGVRAANLTLAESDLVLVLGSRLDHGVTTMDSSAWSKSRKVIHVDCDPAELESRVPRTTKIHADVRAFLEKIIAAAGSRQLRTRQEWLDRVAALKAAHPDTAELTGCQGINPNEMMRKLSRSSGHAAAFVVDAGQHTWWAAQSLRLRAEQRFLPSTGLWALGSAIPCAIGATLASGRPIVAICGDGAFQMNSQELQTIVRNQLPIKIVVVNNQCHGMVRQFQEEFFDAQYPSTLWGYSAPNFVEVAKAYGIAGTRATNEQELAAGLSALWSHPEAASLLEVVIDTYTNVYPHVLAGKSIGTMERFS